MSNKSNPPQCKICDNNVKTWIWGKKCWATYCSNICRTKDKELTKQKLLIRKETCLEKYGTENPAQNVQVKQKRKHTCLEKYGVEHYTNPEQRDITNLERYGYKNPQQNKDIHTKTRQTMLERYGVEYSGQSDVLFEKQKQTKLERYSDEYFTNRPQYIETCLEKYGVPNSLLVPEIQDKKTLTNLERWNGHPWSNVFIRNNIKQTNLEKYGVENPFQNTEIQNKQKQTKLERYSDEYFTNQPQRAQTNLEKYGNISPLGNADVQEKIKQLNIKKYGVRHHNQIHMVDSLIWLESSEWLYNQYVVQHKTSAMIAKELDVDPTTICNYLRKHEIDIIYTVGFSRISIGWLESIMENEGIFIQHILNDGEYRIPGTRYRADGYCQETNTIYEFHGDRFHGNPKIFESEELCHPYNDITAGELYQNTIERENLIKSLGYNLVVMWEGDYVTYP